MALKLITPPAVEPLTVLEVEERLGLPASTPDTLISVWITAARQNIELMLWKALIDQTWDLVYDEFPSDGAIELRLGPWLEVESVNYVDAATGIEVAEDPDNYYVDLVNGWVVPVSGYAWPTPLDAVNVVRVRFRAGFGTTGADVPEPIRQAIVMKVGSFNAMASRSDALLQMETVEGIGTKRWDTSGGMAAAFDEAIDNLLSTYKTMYV